MVPPRPDPDSGSVEYFGCPLTYSYLLPCNTHIDSKTAVPLTDTMRRVFIKREPSPPLRVFSKGDTHNVDNGDVPSRTLYDIAPPEGNQFASPGVGAIDSSLVVGHESALDASPSEMPALKSFYGISQLIGAAEEDESLTEVPVKEEIEQLETVDHNSECDLADSMDDTRNHQRNFASPAINVSKDFRKIQQPHVHMGFRLLVYVTHARSHSIRGSSRLHTTHSSTINYFRLVLIDHQHIHSHINLTLLSNFGYTQSLSPHTTRPLCAEVCSPPVSRLSENNENDPSNAQRIARSSRAHNRIFRLTQCLGSQSRTHSFSLGQNDATNMSVPGFNADGTRGSDSNCLADGSRNHLERYTGFDARQTPGDLEMTMAQMDSQSLFQMIDTSCDQGGGFGQLGIDSGVYQSHISDWSSVPLDPPIPRHTHPNGQMIHNNFQDSRHSSTFETQPWPQPHYSRPKSQDATPDKLFRLDTRAGRPQVDYPTRMYQAHTHTGASLSIGWPSGYDSNHLYSFLGTSAFNMAPSFDYGRPQAVSIPNSNDASNQSITSAGALRYDPMSASVFKQPAFAPRVFHCEKCGKKFRRLSDLEDHKHKHDGIKRHKCPSCGKPLAYAKNLPKHKKMYCPSRVVGRT
ncbi:unnamed protein product [Rhizoctonia solani]|uniref:C2H2-type domain-containing protein n=1 Tax=Rhizoctonia solani TaxID=456999 RepID=A0A8H3E8B3_9AGAM|nr:unnamed protein product [Rhizoctonia solani]